jgi:probable HAF family extracellular repeat protein
LKSLYPSRDSGHCRPTDRPGFVKGSKGDWRSGEYAKFCILLVNPIQGTIAELSKWRCAVMNPLKAVCFLTVLLIASVPLVLAQGTYTQIDEPNAVQATFCYGINTGGDIVGSYADSSGFIHGFLLSGGTYTTIDYPGAQQGTQLFGVNDFGQIVGYTVSPVVGFLYDLATQSFTTISPPGARGTYPLGISDDGTITGYFTYGKGGVSGFELSGSRYRQIKPPGASNSHVSGISTSGELAGYVQSSNQAKNNFIFKRGKYRPITIPNAPYAQLSGINGSGTALVGIYEPTFGIPVGFFYQSKILQELEFPGASQTYAYGVNDAGEVVGYFLDSSFNLHGFIWTLADAAKN